MKNDRLQEFKVLQYQFSSAHFYWNSKWDENLNRQTFGKCANKAGHGHDYRLLIFFPLSLPELEYQSLNKKINDTLEELDHRNLNTQVTAFATKVPTTENILQWLLETIDPDQKWIFKSQLYESQDLWVEWTNPHFKMPMPPKQRSKKSIFSFFKKDEI